MTDAPLPEDPRDALIREQAERLAVQDRQLVQVAVQAEQIAVLEAMVAASLINPKPSGQFSEPPPRDRGRIYTLTPRWD